MNFHSLEWQGQALRLLDQRQLPHRTAFVTCTTAEDVAEAIRSMTVRGAPAIGVAAAFGVVLAAQTGADVAAAAALLRATRPTAVNLMWALDRMLAVSPRTPAALLSAAEQLYAEDIAVNRRIGEHAQALIPDGAVAIHHCNTGALATVGYGTALGALRIAHESGKRIQVYLDETRPRLQGASLSAYELRAFGVPHTLIVDSAAAHVMRTRTVDLCIVGCDRVAANGDVANKIGTYALALAAKAHNVPFYVACPLSTLDLSTPSGDAIEIEERAATEITHIGSQPICPEGTPVFNPAFDVTPAELVTAIITEYGIVRPPFTEGLQRIAEMKKTSAEEAESA
jgi:methylthioribose-1-phosphate isomerase